MKSMVVKTATTGLSIQPIRIIFQNQLLQIANKIINKWCWIIIYSRYDWKMMKMIK